MIDLEAVRGLLSELPALPWEVWTSNSYRRLGNLKGNVLCGTIQRSDGHPDLSMGEGPLSKLVAIINLMPTFLDEHALLQRKDSEHLVCEDEEISEVDWLRGEYDRVSRELSRLVKTNEAVGTERDELKALLEQSDSELAAARDRAKASKDLANKAHQFEVELEELKEHTKLVEEQHTEGLTEMQELCHRDGLGIVGGSVKIAFIAGYKATLEALTQAKGELMHVKEELDISKH